MADALPGAEILAALGRLNGHARAWGCGKHAIYAYKRFAAERLAGAGQLSGRLVLWRGPCRACQGTGKFWFYDPDYKTPCRDCGATGIVKLRFLETTLPDGTVWHHPWSVQRVGFVGYEIAQRLWPGLRYAEGAREPGSYEVPDDSASGWHGWRLVPWEEAGDWSPLQPAEKLAVAELVPPLNLVEDWIDAETAGLRYSRARNQMLAYRLRIGRPAGGCWRCGSYDLASCSLGMLTKPFDWSMPVCKACYVIEPRIWPPDSPPDVLLTDDIRRWAARRGWPADVATVMTREDRKSKSVHFRT